MNRKLFIAIVILFMVGLWAVLVAQERPADATKRTTLGEFMQRKLDHSHALLTALACEDLAAVTEEAQRISMLCLDEDWNLVKTPEYAERSAEFRRTANSVSKGARDKNLAAAQLAYVQLVGQCFSCHEYVRDARKGK